MKYKIILIVIFIICVSISVDAKSKKKKFNWNRIQAISIHCYSVENDDNSLLPALLLKKSQKIITNRDEIKLVRKSFNRYTRLDGRYLGTLPDAYIYFTDNKGRKIRGRIVLAKQAKVFGSYWKRCYFFTDDAKKIIEKYMPYPCWPSNN